MAGTAPPPTVCDFVANTVAYRLYRFAKRQSSLATA